MEYLSFNLTSTLAGIAAVLLVMFLRLHWPFRFQYMANLFKRRLDIRLRWLEASYRKNRARAVAMLDKSTHEIMLGNYEMAEKYIVQGINVCKERPTLFNQAMIHYLFYNLAIVYYSSERYSESLEVAFRIYQRDQGMTDSLALIACSHARLGEVESALEAYQLIASKRSAKDWKLYCLAEIEAAKGNYERALSHLKQLMDKSASFLHLNRAELEKRMEEWKKASTQAS
ncbi:tetratricopeptide repeat protein [Brevibacillus sp. 179-C9.3 HS]|uniref:tetratricopeptide repeat protein n=1 Tax=unclassified Brevibacillus TaxID=2684853 RepID=UPI0039A35AF8